MGFDTQSWVDEFLKVEKRIKTLEGITSSYVGNPKRDTITVGKTGEEYMGFNPTEEEVDEFNWNNNMKVPREQSQGDSYAGSGCAIKPSETAKRASTVVGGVYDAGLHYRKKYKGIKLDPIRIAEIYKINSVQFTILKKVLVTGKRGYKDVVQDYKDIINAASRALEMIEEDKDEH